MTAMIIVVCCTIAKPRYNKKRKKHRLNCGGEIAWDDDGDPQIREVKYKARSQKEGVVQCESILMALRTSVDINRRERRGRKKGRSGKT